MDNMSCFEITFVTSPVPDDTPCTVCGRITIGEFTELFRSPLTFWTKDDYQAHWIISLKRVIEGHDRSCLITSITDPEVSRYLFWWPCYRVGTQDHFPESHTLVRPVVESFNVADPYKSISDRAVSSEEDEYPLSEWSVPISCITRFLQEKENTGGIWGKERGRELFP